VLGPVRNFLRVYALAVIIFTSHSNLSVGYVLSAAEAAFFNHTSMLVGSIFYNAFSVTRPYSVDDRISEWWSGKDLVGSSRGPNFEVLSLHSHDSRSPGSIIEPGTPPEYEVGVLTTRPWRSVTSVLLRVFWNRSVVCGTITTRGSVLAARNEDVSRGCEPGRPHWRSCFTLRFVTSLNICVLAFPFLYKVHTQGKSEALN
jgi:hypothetical protein